MRRNILLHSTKCFNQSPSSSVIFYIFVFHADQVFMIRLWEVEMNEGGHRYFSQSSFSSFSIIETIWTIPNQQSSFLCSSSGYWNQFWTDDVNVEKSALIFNLFPLPTTSKPFLNIHFIPKLFSCRKWVKLFLIGLINESWL